MRKIAFSCLLFIGLAEASLSEPSVVDTQVLGPFAGPSALFHPDNVNPIPILYYGTDLGFTYEHQGTVHILFGDTMANAAGERIEASSGGRLDDSFGTIDLAEWPDPGLITSENIPRIRLGQNAGTAEASAIDPGHVFDGLKTPEAGFSNGSNEFAVLLLTKPQGCRNDGDCENGMSCDASLGFRGVPYFEEAGLTLPCVEGTALCSADTMLTLDEQPIADTGFCTDESSTIWADTPAGRVSAAALRQRIGIRSRSDPRKYRKVRDWMTNKFLNTTVRVQDAGAYLWGRPGFVGVGAKERYLGVYLAYAEMPAAPDFAFEIKYFAGTDETGAPIFSMLELEAVPLDLDSTQNGSQPEEVHDLVQHMSVVRIAHLNKWVMFYGGGIDKTPMVSIGLPQCGLLEVFAGTECRDVVTGNGAIRMRTADDPWGPWSPPQDVIVGGDPAIAGSGQFGVGGVLQHPACTQPGCAPHSPIPIFHDEGHGWFYGANIIEEWIKPVGAGVDVIWNASTWDPYGVVLLRTRIKP